MIVIDNKFIEQFKKIESLGDLKGDMGFRDIYERIVSNDNADIDIVKTFIDFGGSFTNVLNTRHNTGYIKFNNGKNGSQNVLFCEADLSTQIRFFLAILVNFSNETEFSVSSDVMLKLSVIKKIDYADLCTNIINDFRNKINNEIPYDPEQEEYYEAKRNLEMRILNDIISKQTQDLFTIKSKLDIAQIQKVFQGFGKKITFSLIEA